MARVGVFICWCGENIAGTVDVERVAEVDRRRRGRQKTRAGDHQCNTPREEPARSEPLVRDPGKPRGNRLAGAQKSMHHEDNDEKPSERQHVSENEQRSKSRNAGGRQKQNAHEHVRGPALERDDERKHNGRSGHLDPRVEAMDR